MDPYLRISVEFGQTRLQVYQLDLAFLLLDETRGQCLAAAAALRVIDGEQDRAPGFRMRLPQEGNKARGIFGHRDDAIAQPPARGNTVVVGFIPKCTPLSRTTAQQFLLPERIAADRQPVDEGHHLGIQCQGLRRRVRKERVGVLGHARGIIPVKLVHT